MKGVSTFFLILAVLAIISSSESCTCIRKTLQQMFCDEQFVGVVKVLNPVVLNPYSRNNPAIVEKVFKNTANPRIPSETINILTRTGSSLCGVILRPQTSYLIGGSVWEGRLEISACGVVRQWPGDMSLSEKNNFETVYQQKCQCSKRVSHPEGYVTCL